MSHTPLGYIIRDGKAVIDVKMAERVKSLFEFYLFGLSLAEAAKKADIQHYHATIARMLTNKRYLGDGFFPQIIDNDTFQQVETEKLRRAQMLGRIRDREVGEPIIPRICFIASTPQQLYGDPFTQAEYAYSLIESEMLTDDK